MKFPTSEFRPAPAGTFLAQLYGFVDCGTQYMPQYDKSRREVRLFFALIQETMDNGKPYTVSRPFALTYNPRGSLRPFLDTLLGKAMTNVEANTGFDARTLLGRVVMAQIVHTTKDDGAVYANIEAIMALPRGMKAPPHIVDLETHFLSLDPGEFNDDDFTGLPSWMQEKVRNSPEYIALTKEADDKPRRAPLRDRGADEPPFDTDDGEEELKTAAERAVRAKGKAPRMKLNSPKV
jgi:hypothetical protein